MKKYLSLIMTLALLMCMTACSANPKAPNDSADNQTTTTTTQNGNTITIQAHLETDYTPIALYSFDYNVVTTATPNGFMLIDTEGKQIGENSYHMLYSFGEDGRAKAQLEPDSDWVWIDTTGVVVGKAEAPTVGNTTARYDSSETTGVKKDDEYLFGIKDVTTGDLITQPIFEWISDLSSPMNYAVLAESEHPQVMISPRGEVIVTLPDEATDAYAMDAHIVCKYQDGSYRLLDMQGTVLNQTAFKSISSFSDGVAVVTIGTKMGLIAADGKMVVEPQIEIDVPIDNNTPLICNEYIVCVQKEQLTFYKITKS